MPDDTAVPVSQDQGSGQRDTWGTAPPRCELCDGKGQKDGLDCTDCLGTGVDQASAAAWVDWMEEGMP